MYYSYYTSIVFALLPFISQISGHPFTLPRMVPTLVEEEPEIHRPTIMTAVTEHQLAAALGLRKRAVNFSDLDLKEQVQMIYGSKGADGVLHLANVNLVAPSGKSMIMMERFEGLTTAIDCEGSDGEFSMTFQDKEALEYAQSAWSTGPIIMITNHDGCAEKDQRKAYEILTHTADFKTLRLILPDAKPVPWKEVTGTFTVDFGKASVDKRRVRRSAETDPGIGDFFKNIGKDIKKEANKALDKAKDIGKDIKETADKAVEKAKSVVEKVPEKAKEVVKDVKEKAKPIADKVEEVVDKIDDKAKEVGEVVKDGIKKGVDEAKAILDSVLPDSGLEGELEFDLSIGERGKKVPVFQDFTGDFPDVSINCDDCFAAGKVLLSGRAAIVDFQLTELTFDARTLNVEAKIALEILAKRSGDLGGLMPAFNFEQSIFELPLPGGIVIPAIFSAGPTLAFEAGLDSSVGASVSATLGALVKFEDFHVHGNLLDITKSTATGGKPSVAPVASLNHLVGSVDIGVSAAPVLSLGFDILGAFSFDAQLRLTAPRLGAGFDAGFKDGGFCAGSAVETGVSLESTLSTSLVFSVKQKSGGVVGGTFFEHVLFEEGIKLAETCFPVQI